MKNRSISIIVLLMFVLPFIMLHDEAVAQSQPIRVAVLDFDASSSNDLYQYGGNISKLITNKIESGLVNLGSYKMVERTRIESLQREFDLIKAGVIDRETAARSGLVKGADAIIYGSINEFAITGQRQDGQYILNDLGVTLKVQVKMTNAETWSLLLTNEFTGIAPVNGQRPVDNEFARNPGAVIDGVKNIWGAIKNKRAPNLRKTRPDPEAEKEYCAQLVSSAIDSLVTTIISKIQMTKVETTRQVTEIASNISGTVLSVRPGNMIFINGVSTNIVKLGDRLQVKRTLQETDPATGKVIKFDEVIGEVEILEIQSSGIIRSRFSSPSGGTPRKGDKITN